MLRAHVAKSDTVIVREAVESATALIAAEAVREEHRPRIVAVPTT